MRHHRVGHGGLGRARRSGGNPAKRAGHAAQAQGKERRAATVRAGQRGFLAGQLKNDGGNRRL
jgi:hypothetical protein